MRGKPIDEWKPQDDEYLVRTHRALTAKRQAAALRKPYSTVVWRRQKLYKEGRLRKDERCYFPPWTEDEEDFLVENYSRKSMKVLCRKLRRTAVAITLRRRRLGIRRSDGFYNARMLGELLHVDGKVVAWWVDQGWLKGSRAPYHQGLHHPWVFHEEAVRRLIRERPWLFQPARMERHLFRSLVLEEYTRDPWYDLKTAARVAGIGHEHMDVLALKGEIQTVSRQPDRKWSKKYVRKSEIDRWLAVRVQLRRRRLSEAQRATHWRKGHAVRMAIIWRVRCDGCGRELEVQAPPRLRGPQVRQLLPTYHRCQQTAGNGASAPVETEASASQKGETWAKA